MKTKQESLSLNPILLLFLTLLLVTGQKSTFETNILRTTDKPIGSKQEAISFN